MVDAIDELVSRSPKHPELTAFHDFHKQHPEVLDFLVEVIRKRLEVCDSFSFSSLFNYARWKLDLRRAPSDTFKMDDHLCQMYGRAITVLHPEEFNGKAEFRPALADEIFGLAIADEKQPGDYARRLQWADGTSLERGWRPENPHVITHAASLRPDVHARAV